MGNRRMRFAWRRACCALPMCALALALASCDMSVVPAGSHGPIRIDRPAITLRITRQSMSANPYPPFDRTITSALTVVRLYDAALALPKDVGVRYCPVDFGLVYHLAFIGEPASTSQMVLQAQGCRDLLVRPGDARRTDDAFITLFIQTAGLSSLSPPRS